MIRRDERGGIAVMAAMSMLLITGSAALVVDAGRSTSRAKQMQAVADLSSLDAVRAVGDRYVATAVGGALALAAEYATEAAKDRNGFAYDDATAGSSLTVEIGTVDWNTNAFTSIASCQPSVGGCSSTAAQDALANAVRITTGTRVDHAFLPGNTGVSAVAIAGNDAHAGVRVGSSLARFSTSNAAFGPILDELVGFGASFGASDYQGLVNADVALGDLWANLGLGSSDEVLNSDVGYAQMMQATIAALNAEGTPSSVAAATILGSQSGSVDQSATFRFGDWLAVGTGSPHEVASARVNVMDVIAMSAVAANGSNLITTSFPVSVPGVGSVTMSMGIIEPPQLDVGPARTDANGNWVTRARTAQARINLDVTLSSTITVLGTQYAIVVPVYLESGGGYAEVTGIDCQDPLSASPVTMNARANASSAYVGEVPNAVLTGGTVTVQQATFVDDPAVITVKGSSSQTIAASSQSGMTFTGPFDTPPPPAARPSQTVGSTSPNLDALGANLSTSATSPLGALVVNTTLVADQVDALVTPVVQALPDVIADVLESPLGITFGGADVTNTTLNCHLRRLAG